MNPLSKIPNGIRIALYLVYGVGNVGVLYGVAKGWAGDAEVIAWNGLGAVFGITAASNTSLPGEVDDVDGRHERNTP